MVSFVSRFSVSSSWIRDRLVVCGGGWVIGCIGNVFNSGGIDSVWFVWWVVLVYFGCGFWYSF